jgi:hypothetical protein
MFAFIVGNTNFNFDRPGQRNSNIRENRKLKNLAVETKQRMEIVASLNAEACFDFSGGLEDASNTEHTSVKESTFVRQPLDPRLSKSDSDIRSRIRQVKPNHGKIQKKIQQYKVIIKWLDIFASIMIIAGCVISQIENEIYYYENIYDRVEVVKLIENLKIKHGDINKIDLKKFNISYIPQKIPNLNFTDFESLPIPLPISNFCSNLRFIICIMTIASLPLIVFGRYLEFIREYIYIYKIESKFFNL